MANGLCSDEAVQRFVVSGFVQLPPSTAVPPAAHAEIAAQIHRCGVQEAGGPEDARAGRRDPYGLRQLDGDAAGNNLLHAAPALRGPAFLESPHLVATLTRLLGPEYRLHPHCRGHLRKRGAKTSMWHVDAYKGLPWCSGRLHEPHWCMVMYYPQDTTPEMGPTQLLPGTQFYRGDSDRAHYSRGHIPSFGEQLAGWATCVHTVTGPAGTVVVMHYDLWHRALAAASDAPRLMLKFVAWRTTPPSGTGPPPPWPLADGGASEEEEARQAAAAEEEEEEKEEDREGLADEPLLAFLSGDDEQAAHGGGVAGRRRFDRQLDSTDAARAGLPASTTGCLEAHLDSAFREGRLLAGAELLTPKGAADAEKHAAPAPPSPSPALARPRPPSPALALARHLSHAVPCIPSSSRRLFSSAVAAAKKEAADGSALPPTPTHLMPALLAWLAPRCAALVQRAAARERRALFVRERRPVWRHVWAWLHGQAAAPRLVSPARATRLSGTLRTAAEPARLRAAYELAQATAAEAAEALLAVVSDAGAATSVRRTAAYGLSAASCVSAAQCERLLFLAAGSDGAEGGAEGVEPCSLPPTALRDASLPPSPDAASGATDPILGVALEEPSRWLSASLLRASEGPAAACLPFPRTPPPPLTACGVLRLRRRAASRRRRPRRGDPLPRGHRTRASHQTRGFGGGAMPRARARRAGGPACMPRVGRLPRLAAAAAVGASGGTRGFWCAVRGGGQWPAAFTRSHARARVGGCGHTRRRRARTRSALGPTGCLGRSLF